jgi:hypothetical protein
LERRSASPSGDFGRQRHQLAIRTASPRIDARKRGHVEDYAS